MRLEIIEDILDEFDFNRVLIAMKALEWEWFHAEEGLPSLGELRKQARSLLEYAYNKEDCPSFMTGTGGFEAIRTIEPDDSTKYLSLKFVVSEWNNYE